jgi:UDP-N-acetylenolpyruvoylglucosamine reductase
MDLVRHIQATVQADSGYFLEMEIRCIGEFL